MTETVHNLGFSFEEGKLSGEQRNKRVALLAVQLSQVFGFAEDSHVVVLRQKVLLRTMLLFFHRLLPHRRCVRVHCRQFHFQEARRVLYSRLFLRHSSEHFKVASKNHVAHEPSSWMRSTTSCSDALLLCVVCLLSTLRGAATYRLALRARASMAAAEARRTDVRKIVYAHKSPEGIQLVAHKPVRHTTVCVCVWYERNIRVVRCAIV
jgi:hypothetical protein